MVLMFSVLLWLASRNPVTGMEHPFMVFADGTEATNKLCVLWLVQWHNFAAPLPPDPPNMTVVDDPAMWSTLLFSRSVGLIPIASSIRRPTFSRWTKHNETI